MAAAWGASFVLRDGVDAVGRRNVNGAWQDWLLGVDLRGPIRVPRHGIRGARIDVVREFPEAVPGIRVGPVDLRLEALHDHREDDVCALVKSPLLVLTKVRVFRVLSRSRSHGLFLQKRFPGREIDHSQVVRGALCQGQRAERPLTKGGGAPPRRSRDPRVHAAREARELDYNSAQLTARKRAANRRRWSDTTDYDRWLAVAHSAFQKGGATVRPYRMDWNAAGRCEAPVFRTLKGRSTDLFGVVEVSSSYPTAYMDMWVPCRKCRVCLWKKARHWTFRAMTEIGRSSRTWFVTLTFNAAARAQLVMRASTALGEEVWTTLSSEQRSAALAGEAGKDVTLWLKRVRQESGAAFRYLYVAELHKDGTPHAHLLIHEDRTPIRHKVLAGQWRRGFSNVKLVETPQEAAAYVNKGVAKYLSKNPVTRVRASVGYGHGGEITPLGIGGTP
ncbi:MAG: replication initiator protein [Arizlama microvirus]|nr:MAG: replication initiator protein [Arizlama microvirus]